jgi:DNA polymerase I-like protein with 3'-5' exonuclease and polymerase domains
VPLWLRAAFVAPPGRAFVGADYDQLELRGSAALAGDPELIKRCMAAVESRKLEPDYDPHSFVAGFSFAAAYTGLALADPAHHADPKCRCETCKRKALRNLVKRVIYGLNYGAGEQTVLEAIYSTGDYVGPPITIEMVAHVKRTYFKLFPEVPKWRDAIYRDARQSGELRSPLHGRRRIFPLDDVPLTEVYNFPIQSLAADIMNEQSLLFVSRLPAVDPTAFVFAQVHDALYIECAEDCGDAVSRLLEDTLTVEHVLRDGAPAMRFTVHAKVSKDWRS